MSEIFFLTAFTNLISAVAVILTLYMIYLSVKEIVNRKTRYSFIAVLLCQILQQILVITTYQIEYSSVVETFVFLLLLLSFSGQINVVVNILGTFSLLDDRITTRRLKIFKYSIFGAFFVLTAPTVVYLVALLFPYADVRTIPFEAIGFVLIVVTILIDQSMAVYLTVLIFRLGKATPKYNQLVKSIIHLATQAFLDYAGCAIEAYLIISFGGSSYSNIPNITANLYQLATTTATLHLASSVYTFILFKRLFIAGAVKKVKLIDVKDPQKVADNHKKVEISPDTGEIIRKDVQLASTQFADVATQLMTKPELILMSSVNVVDK